jgi:Lon protease-like protein
VTTTELPLFPLSSVLFPGGPLTLRIFESRYLDMVRECSRTDSGFGVCLILGGGEVGAAAQPAAVGTLARIVDFYTLPDGLLGITAAGGERFHVERTRMRHDGLLRGDVEYLPSEPLLPVPAEYGLLATLLERIAEKAGGDYERAPHANFDNASWVGFRLAELLPLENIERQQLLITNDPIARLRLLTEYLQRFQHD